MFTGIVQHLGRVISIEKVSFGKILSIDAQCWSHRPELGQSIAVDGCCLTIAPNSADGLLCFDVIHPTLNITSLGSIKVGDLVNLEHAVTPTTMLGGHVVQGHIDGLGTVLGVMSDESQCRLRVEPPSPLMDHIVSKGSIAINGVSLTVAEVGDDWFEVALIPTTLKLTNLAGLRPGDKVNLETDYVAKVVVNWLRRHGEPK